MTYNKSLEIIANKYGTDKLAHGYIPYYETYMPPNSRTMIEIGAAKGASALMFDEYFNNDIDIHIVDLFINTDFVSTRWCRNRNFVPYAGSQSDINFLSSIKAQADFIEEDASHNCADQLITWKHLFVNNLKSGGVYFMEDTHTSQPTEKFYWGGGVEKFEDTPLWLFENYLITGKVENFMFRKEEALVFENLIDSVHIEADRKLIIIKKK
jgi:hypothetical protein